MLSLIAFIIGTVLGSFALWLAQQLIQGKVDWCARSRCATCQRVLKWWDLIPIFSQLRLHSRCRYCHTKLPAYYWISELSAGLLAALWYVHLGKNLTHPLQLIYGIQFVLLLTMCWCDYFTYIIPDRLQLCLLSLCLYLTSTQNQWQWQLLMSSWLVGLLLILYFLRPNWLGGADVKLLALLLPTIPFQMHAYFIGGSTLIGFIYYLVTRRWHSPLPFIPCIALSYYGVLLFLT